MKLNHYLAQSGLCARRNAVALIKDGSVTVNNKPETNPAYEVQSNDIVAYKKKTIIIPTPIYILVNKPAGYVTTTADEEGRPTVLDLLPNTLLRKTRLFPVGRLDKETTGLILLTNDGQLAQQLAHPRYKVSKEYIVTLDQPITQQNADILKKGVYLRDGRARIDNFFLNQKNKQIITVTLHSGKKHIIRRLFEHIGYRVRGLERVAFGPFTIRGLKVGAWKQVTIEKEQLIQSKPKNLVTQNFKKSTQKNQ